MSQAGQAAQSLLQGEASLKSKSQGVGTHWFWLSQSEKFLSIQWGGNTDRLGQSLYVSLRPSRCDRGTEGLNNSLSFFFLKSRNHVPLAQLEQTTQNKTWLFLSLLYSVVHQFWVGVQGWTLREDCLHLPGSTGRDTVANVLPQSCVHNCVSLSHRAIILNCGGDRRGGDLLTTLSKKLGSVVRVFILLELC